MSDRNRVVKTKYNERDVVNRLQQVDVDAETASKAVNGLFFNLAAAWAPVADGNK
jgi:hypothetical protein